MANPNPYKDVKISGWILDAIERGDKEKIIHYLQFCLHVKDKFERCYQREYNQNLKFREQLGLPIKKRVPKKEFEIGESQ